MATSFAAIVGGIGGALAFLSTIIFFLWFCVSQCRKYSNKSSETGSSDPSAIEMKRGGTSPFSVPSLAGIRQFRIEELEQATRNFNESNLIGFGTFGLVFKGLLSDGTVVAIKRRNGDPRPEFSEEVAYLSTIWHRNLVTLLGCCQERGYQMLVSEYLPNGSMCNHLYDAGVSKILEKIEHGTSSGSSSFNAFRDPELGQLDVACETSDVYSFGVFLLELMSGKETTTNKDAFLSNDSILQWVEEHLRSNDLVDHRLVGSFTAEGMRDVLKLMLKCMSFPGKGRPGMENVVVELDQILEREIERTTIMGEGTATVTPGSQLFTN